MACYIISYDLVSPNRNYDALYGAIKSLGPWAHVTESLWAVVTEKSAVEVRNYLSGHIDGNDRLFVLRSGSEGAWRNVICSSEWLKERL